MKIREIHFNHDRRSAKRDAINIRQDAVTPIAAPEWVYGTKGLPAAYASAALQDTVTIKAKFYGGPANGTVPVRAIEFNPTGPVPPFTRNTTVLGDVLRRPVEFNQNGESALVLFEITGLPQAAPVSISEFTWTWQSEQAGRWVDFATTKHKVYVIPDLPKAPWSLEAEIWSRYTPWSWALDQACEWAAGATNTPDAIEKIARRLNEHPKHVYDESGTQFVQKDALNNYQFNLTSYLVDLAVAESITIDCRGITTALVTFANALGAGLRPLSFKNSPATGQMTTNRILALSDVWTVETWSWHEVALTPGTLLDANGFPDPAGVVPDVDWIGTGGEQRIYDANLHFDETPPLMPVGMPFGQVGAGDYRHKLVAVGDAAIATPKPNRSLF